METNCLCWFCQKDLNKEKYYFSYEFDTPICNVCMNKLKNDPSFANHDEGDIMRDEFDITKKKR